MKLSIIEKLHLILIAVTVAGLIFSIRWSGQQHQALLKQMKLQSFSEYTKRYQEINMHMPLDIYNHDFNIDSLEESQQSELLRNMRAYFDLCSEEYYLGKNDLIENYIWAQWKSGMAMSMKSPAYQRSWEIISKHSAYDESFKLMINKMKL